MISMYHFSVIFINLEIPAQAQKRIIVREFVYPTRFGHLNIASDNGIF